MTPDLEAAIARAHEAARQQIDAEDALLAEHPVRAEAFRKELEGWGLLDVSADPPHDWRCRADFISRGVCHHNETLIAGLVRVSLDGTLD